MVTVRIGQCDECEDKPLTIEAWNGNDIIYGKDIRPEEYEDLDDFISEVVEIAEDMLEHDQAQGD